MVPVNPKRELFEHFARIGKAVGSPARLELKELRAASLVSTRKDGPYVFYRLADPSVQDFLRSLQALAHRQLADVRQIVQDYLERPDDLEPVETEALLDRIRAGEVVVLDVRPEAVALLRSRGFRARRLADGLPDWTARGLPVAAGHTH